MDSKAKYDRTQFMRPITIQFTRERDPKNIIFFEFATKKRKLGVQYRGNCVTNVKEGSEAFAKGVEVGDLVMHRVVFIIFL